MGHVVLPIDPGEQGLPGPLPPRRGERRLLQILPHAFPPKIDESGQGRQLVADLVPGVLPCGELMGLGYRFQGGDFGFSSALDLRGRLGRGVVDVKRMQREREDFQVVAIRATHSLPSLHVHAPHLHLVLGR